MDPVKQTATYRPHSAARLARVIIAGIAAEEDPRTLEHLGRHAGLSSSALRLWCMAAGEYPRHVLDFVRVLRAVRLRQTVGWGLRETLDIVDARSLTRLLKRGELTSEAFANGMSLETFLHLQRFVRGPLILQEVARHLANVPGRQPAAHPVARWD